MGWCFPWMQKAKDNVVSLFSSRKADSSLPLLQGGGTEGESCIEGKSPPLIMERQMRFILMGVPNWVRIPLESLLAFW